jgi:cbb3-type cytochrome oxidase subunit 1
MTMKGKWGQGADDLPLRFAMTSALFYLMTCLQGPFQATRWINWYIHFTQWVVGHAHAALLGAFSFILTSAIYYTLPRVTGREWHSKGLMCGHYWLKFIGFLIMYFSLTVAGLIQSAGWAMGIPVDQWSNTLYPYWFVRAISGIMIVTGQALFCYNAFRTLYTPKAVEVTAKTREVKV